MIKSRPIFLTLVCFYLIGYGSYRLVTSFAYLNNPAIQDQMQLVGAPYLFQVVMLYLNFITMIVTGIAMMEEANWARWVYLGWGFVFIDYNLYVQPEWRASFIPVAIYLISAVILVVPSANAFFSSEIPLED